MPKPKAVYFEGNNEGIHERMRIAYSIPFRELIEKDFDVKIIEGDADFAREIEAHQADLAIFSGGIESDANIRPPSITNLSEYPDIPRIGLMLNDLYGITRLRGFRHLEACGCEAYFGVYNFAQNSIPELADRFFTIPFWLNEDIFKDYEHEKVIPLGLYGAGFTDSRIHYPWRIQIARQVFGHFPCFTAARPDASVKSSLVGSAFAELLNRTKIAFACGSINRSFTRKHLETCGTRTALFCQKIPIVESLGFKDGENCVFVTEANVREKVAEYLSDEAKLQRISDNGYDFVRAQHRIESRKQIAEWYSLRKAGVGQGRRIAQTDITGPLQLVNRSVSGANIEWDTRNPMDRVIDEAYESLWAGDIDLSLRKFQLITNGLRGHLEARTGEILCQLRNGNLKIAFEYLLQFRVFLLNYFGCDRNDEVLEALLALAMILDRKKIEEISIEVNFPLVNHPLIVIVRELLDTGILRMSGANKGSKNDADFITLQYRSKATPEKWWEMLEVIFNANDRSDLWEELTKKSGHSANSQDLNQDLMVGQKLDIQTSGEALESCHTAPDVCAQAQIPYVTHFHGADPQPLVYGPYGVSVQVERIAQPADVAPVFVSVGRFVEKKAPQRTLQAFEAVYRKVPDARLIMIGDGPLLGICRQWVKEQNIESVVTFAGVQSRESVSRILSKARVFVQHSVCASTGDREGLPLAILEAGAHGLPVVSTVHAGIPDAVRDKQDGFLVTEHDVAWMAQAMYQLAIDPEMAARMGRSFRERVCGHFSRSIAIGRLQGLLGGLIQEGTMVDEAGEVDIDNLEAALEAARSSQAAWCIAEKAEAQGETELAFAASRKAVTLDRNFGPGYVMMGRRLVQVGKYQDAYLCMKEASRVGGLSPEIEQSLIELEASPELNDEAIAVYRDRIGLSDFGRAENPKKILVFTNLLPPQEMGGYGRSMWELCDGLIQRGHEVRILTADVKHLEQTPYPGYERVEQFVERSLRLFGDWKNGRAEMIDDTKLVHEIVRHNVSEILQAVNEFKPDACMAGNLDFLSGLMLDPILKHQIPIVHRLGNATPGYEANQTPKSPLYCIAGCSHWVNEELQRGGYAARNFAFLPPGAPLREYYRLLMPQFGSLRICYAGLMMAYKGPHILLQALKCLKQLKVPFTCEFAGDFKDPKYEAQFKQQIFQDQLQNEVRLLGFCDREQLGALYARSNLLVMPSIFEEPFGKVQIEAQAAGLAVIRAPVGGYRDLITDGVNGLLYKREDARDLARQIYILHKDEDLWQKIATQGQADAFRYTSESSVLILEEIFNELSLQCASPTVE